MANPNDITAKDIPFLLEQLELQNRALVEAEETIRKLERPATGHAMTADEKDEADLEIETLQDR